MGINRLASALASAGSVYEADNDPEFVRLAAPSTLKTVEMLLSQAPNNSQLLLTACSGFTEYSYAFLHSESLLRAGDAVASQELRTRAIKMYQRSRGYCMRGLDLKHPGMSKQLTAGASAEAQAALKKALESVAAADVPWLYWTAASWGAELSLSPNQLLRIPELAAVRALLLRARALDEAWDHGAIHEALITLDGLPPLLGGSPAAARADFERALALSNGKSAFAYVALAATLSDPAEKRRLLEEAVKIDVSTAPGRRLTNLIAQRSARAMLRDSQPASPAVR
jgi:TRAP transporter TatT component family protein